MYYPETNSIVNHLYSNIKFLKKKVRKTKKPKEKKGNGLKCLIFSFQICGSEWKKIKIFSVFSSPLCFCCLFVLFCFYHSGSVTFSVTLSEQESPVSHCLSGITTVISSSWTRDFLLIIRSAQRLHLTDHAMAITRII